MDCPVLKRALKDQSNWGRMGGGGKLRYESKKMQNTLDAECPYLKKKKLLFFERKKSIFSHFLCVLFPATSSIFSQLRKYRSYSFFTAPCLGAMAKTFVWGGMVKTLTKQENSVFTQKLKENVYAFSPHFNA